MRTRSLLRYSLAALAVVAATAAFPSASHAIIFDLTSDHCTGGCGTAPFGTVTSPRLGRTSISQWIWRMAYSWAKTGAADFQAFKFNGTGVALGDITVNQTFAGQTLAPQTGAFNGDGTGNFSFGIACTTCGNGASAITSNIVFHVANASIADVTAPNNLLNIFVADVFSSQTGNTGPVDVHPCPARSSEQASRVWSWLAAVFSPWRDAVVSSSSETTPFLCIDDELKACWLSPLASTLLLWARQHATRKKCGSWPRLGRLYIQSEPRCCGASARRRRKRCTQGRSYGPSSAQHC